MTRFAHRNGNKAEKTMKKPARYTKDTDRSSLLGAIAECKARIGIIGLGYVGLPLGCLFAEKGFSTTGFDIDPPKVTALNADRSYIKHIPSKRIAAIRRSGAFEATDDLDRLRRMDVIIICVPTPLT